MQLCRVRVCESKRQVGVRLQGVLQCIGRRGSLFLLSSLSASHFLSLLARSFFFCRPLAPSLPRPQALSTFSLFPFFFLYRVSFLYPSVINTDCPVACPHVLVSLPLSLYLYLSLSLFPRSRSLSLSLSPPPSLCSRLAARGAVSALRHSP